MRHRAGVPFTVHTTPHRYIRLKITALPPGSRHVQRQNRCLLCANNGHLKSKGEHMAARLDGYSPLGGRFKPRSMQGSIRSGSEQAGIAASGGEVGRAHSLNREGLEIVRAAGLWSGP